MKRNVHGMLGGNRPANRGPRANNSSRGPGAGQSTGPLMTEHLHDLDLELALLKRKREILEEQQQVLVTEHRFNRQNHYDYEQSPQSFSQQSYDEPQRFNQALNFSSFYNDSPGPVNSFDRQHGAKRQAADDWQNNSSNKRFSGPSRGRPKKPSQPGPAQQSYRSGLLPAPIMKPFGQHIVQRTGTRRGEKFSSQLPSLMGQNKIQSKPKPNVSSRNDFYPTKVKVTKPSARPSAPNKLNSYPMSERKNLVAQASNLVSRPPKQDLVLHADKTPSPQLKGRLELGLGTLLKELKEEYGHVEPHVFSFQNGVKLRAMKQAIRERIWGVMLGKSCDTSATIVDAYRKKYPKNNDIEILNLGLKKVGQQHPTMAIRPIETENPEKYFKLNFNKLLSKKLDEMFETIQKVYVDDEFKGKSMHEIMKTILEEENETESKKDSNDPKPAEETQIDLTTDTDCNNLESTKQAAEINGKDETKSDINQKDESKTDENQKDEPKTDETQKDESKTDGTQELNNKIDETQKDDTIKIDLTKNEQEKKGSSEVDLTLSDDVKNDSKMADDTENVDSKLAGNRVQKARFYNRMIDALLKRKLPYLLPKYKDHIVRILNVNEEYKTTKAAIIMGANDLAEKYVKNKKDLVEKGSDVTTTTNKSPRPSLRFVKILGQPELPSRKVMQSFLNGFHPKLIKKHRNVNNLLYVGLSNLEDFENLIANNQIVIGKCTLDIKVSDKAKPNNENETPAKSDETDVAVVDNTNNNQEENNPKNECVIRIDEELDDQINDLLSSIREEEDKTKIKIEAVVEENSTQNTEVKGESNDKEGGEKKVEADNIAEPAKTDENKVDAENKAVESLKNEVQETGKTPARASARVANATPSTIRTRRASRLAQNN